MPEPVATKVTWEIETSGENGPFTRFEVSRGTRKDHRGRNNLWYNLELRNGNGYMLSELAQFRDWLNDFLKDEGYNSVTLT